jgi:6-phosphogluconate dehydrogenase (decarboxylating)
MKIGVIGIGDVGMAVAIGLKSKGHKIICYDTDKIKLKLAKEAGLKVAYNLKNVLNMFKTFKYVISSSLVIFHFNHLLNQFKVKSITCFSYGSS